jgi:hypothetical protein
VEWPGLQILHGKPPWPDANRLAYESIREQTNKVVRAGIGETAKLLLRHTIVDLRLRGDKDLERLRA